MAAISFYILNGTVAIQNTSGSGLGFFGSAGFGASVLVSNYQDNTYITDGNGVNQGAMAENIKYLTSGSGYISTASSGVPVNQIPNAKATLDVRFTNAVILHHHPSGNISNKISFIVSKLYTSLQTCVAVI